MRARLLLTLWCGLTPIQRALLQRVAREGPLGRMMPWEGRTVRSLVARDLLRRGAHRGSDGWVLTSKARRVLSLVTTPPRTSGAPPES